MTSILDDLTLRAARIRQLEEQNDALLEACKMARFLYAEGDDMFEGMQEATAYATKTKVTLDKAIALAEGE